MSAARGVKPLFGGWLHLDFLCEFRPLQKPGVPSTDLRMQPRDWIAGKRKAVGVNEPRNIEDSEHVPGQIGLLAETLFELVESRSELARGCPPRLVGDPVFRDPLPEIDLMRLVSVLRSTNGARAAGGVFLQCFGRL